MPGVAGLCGRHVIIKLMACLRFFGDGLHDCIDLHYSTEHKANAGSEHEQAACILAS